ncbi:MAG: hypothetical protein K0R10_1193 [Alphaproteobacteria bacterium]|jgi:hypothetical protein|nr:hypothetical protein [Alphaproteobacteria bacterium]
MKSNFLPENYIPFLMTQSDLKKLGLEEVGYVKQYQVNGKPAWVLHAADGTALAVQGDSGAALNSARHHELDLVSVH